MISYLFSASFSDVGDIIKMSEGYVNYDKNESYLWNVSSAIDFFRNLFLNSLFDF